MKQKTKNNNAKPVTIFFFLLVSLNLFFELGGRSTDDFVDLLTTLVELEGGHGGDTLRLGDIVEFININLDDLDFGGVVIRELVKGGGDHLARTAPSGEEVNDGELFAGDGLLEGFSRFDLLNGHFF